MDRRVVKTPGGYDFPHRLRTPGAARREIRKLDRSITAATLRGEKRTVAYLEARRQRAAHAAPKDGQLLDLGPGLDIPARPARR